MNGVNEKLGQEDGKKYENMSAYKMDGQVARGGQSGT